MSAKIFFYHVNDTICDKMSNFLENIKVLYFFTFAIILYYICNYFSFFSIILNFFIKHYFMTLLSIYLIFFVTSFFISLKSTNFFRNSLISFFIFKDIDSAKTIHYISLYFILIYFTHFINAAIIKCFSNPRTTKDLYLDRENFCYFLLCIFLYYSIDISIIILLYLFSTEYKGYFEKFINPNIILNILFFYIFYLGGNYYEKISKRKKPKFANIIKRIIFTIFIDITASVYFLKLFSFIEQKEIMKKDYLFLLFILAIFVLGFVIELIFNKLTIYELIRKNFNIWLYTIALIFYFPFIREKDSIFIIIICLIIIRTALIFNRKLSENSIYNYFSDCSIFAMLIYKLIEHLEKIELIVAVVTVALYAIIIIIEFLIAKVNAIKYCAAKICNLLFICLICKCSNARREARKIEITSEMDIVNSSNNNYSFSENKEEQNKNNEIKNLYHLSNNNNRTISMVDIAIIANCFDLIKSKIKCDENCCIVRLQKNLDECLEELDKSKKNAYNYPTPTIPFSSKKIYDLNQILEISQKLTVKYDLQKIETTLEKNYNDSLIDDKIYSIKWNNEICKKYKSKFRLFSLGSLGEDKPYNNTVTIFVSGFLTEDENSFARQFYNYEFSNNKKSDYYFYLWPSCGQPDTDRNICEQILQTIICLNGIWCKFEEAYKNAIIAGEILAKIIGTKNFFGDAKINLVGHSLGCRVICECLEYFSDNYKEINDVINDVILLAGATTMNDKKFNEKVKKFVKGRFIHCYNKNDFAFFISQPFSESPIGIRKIDPFCITKGGHRWHSKKDEIIESYETDLGHTDYCPNLERILYKIPRFPKISFI